MACWGYSPLFGYISRCFVSFSICKVSCRRQRINSTNMWKRSSFFFSFFVSVGSLPAVLGHCWDHECFVSTRDLPGVQGSPFSRWPTRTSVLSWDTQTPASISVLLKMNQCQQISKTEKFFVEGLQVVLLSSIVLNKNAVFLKRISFTHRCKTMFKTCPFNQTWILYTKNANKKNEVAMIQLALFVCMRPKHKLNKL